MSEVAVTLEVMPEDTEVDLEELKKEINSRIDVEKITEEDVAFGLKALKVLIVLTDEAGGTDQVEESLLDIPSVKNVKVTDQRKLM